MTKALEKDADELLRLADLEPEAAALEAIDGPSDLAPPDKIPTSDRSMAEPTYRDWAPGNSEVITCRIGNDLYPGRRFESREEARRTIEKERGRILEANFVPGRAFFRVRKR